MTAIVLAAGVGKRMGAAALPKCLLTVGGRSLLQRTMENLRAAGVGHLVLVVGYRKEEVAAHAQRYAGGMRITLVENPRFQEGAILSLWAARDYLDRNALVMDADLLAPQAVFDRLVGSRHRDCLLVDGKAEDTGEEQMVFGEGGRVFHITKRPPQGIRERFVFLGESLGFLKLSSEGARILRGLLEAKVREGMVGIEHEQVYPDLFQAVAVGFERVDGMPWTEIDTSKDLERARREVFPLWGSSPCLNRRISSWFLPWVLRLPLTPNQWTFLGLVLGMGSALCLSIGSYGWDVASAVLFQIFYVTDNWDGDVARARGLSSRWGGWFDVIVDMVVQVAFVVCLTVGLRKQGAPAWVPAVGGLAVAGIFLDFAVTLWAKYRGFGPSVCGDPARVFGGSSQKRFRRWLSVNLTHENFSLLAAALLLFKLKLAFLTALALGSHLFWIGYLRREGKRLYSFAQARR